MCIARCCERIYQSVFAKWHSAMLYRSQQSEVNVTQCLQSQYNIRIVEQKTCNEDKS